jgi:hypothetical protein
MSPSPATQLEEERSFNFILLLAYVTKSDQCGEIQNNAPVLMMSLEATILLERQNGASIVETIVRCMGIVPNLYLVV